MDPSLILPNQHIKTIFHVSDVHIHNQGRYQEYQQVFKTLVKQIQSHPRYHPETSIIINTGDTLDRCGKMSAEAIDLTHQLRTQLSNLAYNFWIPGNHDVKRDNDQQTELDSLSAILAEHRDQHNFVYHTETGVRLVGDNLAIFHLSVIPDEWRDSSFIPSQMLDMGLLPENQQHRTKIALCHAGIDSALGQNQYLLRGCEYKLNDFDGFDLVLLGDTHQYQLLGPQQRMAYSGSLIQQNFGEDLHQHGGCIVWNLENLTTEFLPIPNQYSFRTFQVRRGKMTQQVQPPLSPFTRIRFRHDAETTSQQLKQLAEHLATQYQSEIIDLRSEPIKTKTQARTPTPITGQIYDTNAQFQEYLLQQHPPDLANQLVALDQTYKKDSELLGTSQIVTATTQLISLTWHNMFNYQDGPHQLDFQALVPGIISIYGKNKQGKTKIVDTLLLAIYGIEPRFTHDIINKHRKEARTEIIFARNQDRFRITRTFRKKKHGGDSTLELVQLNNDDTIKHHLSERVKKHSVNNTIKKLVGDPDILLYSNISQQDQHQNFTGLDAKSRTKLLKQILDTEQYDEIYKKVTKDLNHLRKDQILPTEQKINTLSQTDAQHATATLQLEDMQQSLAQQRQQLEKTEADYAQALSRSGQINSLQTTIQTTKPQITHLQTNLQTIGITSSTQYKQQLATLETETSNHQTKLDTLTQQRLEAYGKLHPIQNQDSVEKLIESLTQQHHTLLQQQTTHQQQLTTDQPQLSDINQQLPTVTQQRQTTQTQITQLQTKTTRSNWKYTTTKQYQQAIKTTQLQLDQLQQQLDTYPDDLGERVTTLTQLFQDTDAETIRHQHDGYLSQTQQRDLLNQQQTKLQHSLQSLQQSISKNPYQYNEYCTDCTHNQKIDPFSVKQQEIRELTDRITDNQAQLQHLNQTLQQTSQIPTTYQKFTEYEQLTRTHFQYQQLVATKTKTHQLLAQLQHESTEYQQYKLDMRQLESCQQLLHTHNKTHQQLETQQTKLTQSIQQHTTQLQDTKLQLHTVTQTLQQHQRDQQYLQDNARVQAIINKLDTQIQQTETRVTQNSQQITELNQQFSEWKSNQPQLESLQQTLQTLETELSQLVSLPQPDQIATTKQQLTHQIDQDRTQQIHTTQLIERLTEDQHTLAKLQTKLAEDTTKYTLLTHYKDAIKQFPTMLVNQSIAHLADEANKVLMNLTKDFTLVIRFEEGKDIFDFVKLSHNKTETYLDYCSGFERLAIGMALRYALTRIGHTSNINTLIIDEGFGVMDQENLTNAPNWLEPLTQIYHHVFIITHIEELQSAIPHKIRVKEGTVCCEDATSQ
jgi:DNA repair exonuclease SbcCD ATPase subunit